MITEPEIQKLLAALASLALGFLTALASEGAKRIERQRRRRRRRRAVGKAPTE